MLAQVLLQTKSVVHNVKGASGDVLGPKSGDDAAVEDGDVHLATVCSLTLPAHPKSSRHHFLYPINASTNTWVHLFSGGDSGSFK